MGMGRRMGRRMGRKKEARERDMVQYYKAIAARYDEIDGGRVVLDYKHFVAAYTYSIDFFYFSSKMAVGALRG